VCAYMYTHTHTYNFFIIQAPMGAPLFPQQPETAPASETKRKKPRNKKRMSKQSFCTSVCIAGMILIHHLSYVYIKPM